MIARFFLWDPEVLCKGIPCPNCRTRLHRHGYVPYPRRCVDFDGRFWIIGFEYRCPSCADEVKKGKSLQATFRSWDSRILKVIPRELATEFPAYLSHRSGLSKSLFMFMRSLFQCGVGAKQFADAVRVQHLEKYDELHLQYLHVIAARVGLARWCSQKFNDFLPFTDRSSKGPHGFVPGSQWLRDMFDKRLAEHAEELNQRTSLLSAKICAIDHSHKVSSILISRNTHLTLYY